MGDATWLTGSCEKLAYTEPRGINGLQLTNSIAPYYWRSGVVGGDLVAAGVAAEERRSIKSIQATAMSWTCASRLSWLRRPDLGARAHTLTCDSGLRACGHCYRR